MVSENTRAKSDGHRIVPHEPETASSRTNDAAQADASMRQVACRLWPVLPLPAYRAASGVCIPACERLINGKGTNLTSVRAGRRSSNRFDPGMTDMNRSLADSSRAEIAIVSLQ